MKGFLTNQFQRAVLLGMTSMTLLTSSIAQAQSPYNPSNVPSTGPQMTQAAEPWKSNATYMQEMEAARVAHELRVDAIMKREAAANQSANARQAQSTARSVGRSRDIFDMGGGIFGSSAQGSAARTTASATASSALARETEYYTRITVGIETKYARQYERAVQTAQRDQQRQLQSSQRGGRQAPSFEEEQLKIAKQAALRAQAQGKELKPDDPNRKILEGAGLLQPTNAASGGTTNIAAPRAPTVTPGP